MKRRAGQRFNHMSALVSDSKGVANEGAIRNTGWTERKPVLSISDMHDFNC